MEKEKLTVDSVKNFEAEVDYTTVLDNFEGPLDLLLHLIKIAEVDVKDIFVSEVTNQFLEYVYNSDIDMETESEYLSITNFTNSALRSRSASAPQRLSFSIKQR